jgi:hypothetical protein
MGKTIIFLIMKTNSSNSITQKIFLIWLLIFTGLGDVEAQVNYCQPEPPNIPASCASQIGNSTVASGNSSFAAGQFDEALGISSISHGHNSIADGHYSISLGQSCFSGSQSYSRLSIGKQNEFQQPASYQVPIS